MIPIKRIAAITAKPCDITDIMQAAKGVRLELIAPGDVLSRDLDSFDALLILGGADDQPLLFPAMERLKVEEQIGRGKRVLCEYCQSVGPVYFTGPESSRYLRLAYAGGGLSAAGLRRGALLEDQCNSRLRPFLLGEGRRPILLYRQTSSQHRSAAVGGKAARDVSNWAMWFQQENLLLCMFRVCNFSRARMAPLNQWRSLVTAVLEWLCGGDCGVADAVAAMEMPYGRPDAARFGTVEAYARRYAEKAVQWFEANDLLVDGGRRGVLEGLGTEIQPDGAQRRSAAVRTDCSGEAAMMYYLHSLMTGNRESLRRADSLMTFCFTAMQVRQGPFKGMLRWTETAWETCYQDDAARALLPCLYRCLYSGDRTHLEDCADALRFLANTTGTDGTRVKRTDSIELTPLKLDELAANPGCFPSAHYNAYYLAALLLCHKLTSDEQFRRVGVQGVETIMEVYPDTVREQSETEELCRLVLPLAMLYWVTGDEKHRRWLYRVTGDLQRFRHPSGAYLEWDTGYQASCSRKKNSECSMLSRNGDPVVDLLYSMNWLPVGLIQAWFVTGDRYFYELWEGVARFMCSVQIQSADKAIDGVWARGYDVELMEVYANPNDGGWGPWAVESGWTMAEIASGLMMGLLKDRLAGAYGVTAAGNPT